LRLLSFISALEESLFYRLCRHRNETEEKIKTEHYTKGKVVVGNRHYIEGAEEHYFVESFPDFVPLVLLVLV